MDAIRDAIDAICDAIETHLTQFETHLIAMSSSVFVFIAFTSIVAKSVFYVSV